MNKEQIILQLYRDETIEKSLETFCPAHLRMDLKQHIFASLLEKSEEEIVDMYNKNGMLQFYVGRTILNCVRGNGRSDFNRLFNSCGIELKDNASLLHEDYNYDEDRLLSDCEAAAQDLYGYHQNVLMLYMECGSYRKTAARIGIPYKSVFNAVQAARNQIKKKVCT